MRRRAGLLAPVAALGIVFGDIGTSPLYAIKELIYNSGADHSTEGAVGAISLAIWLLTVVICVKYVCVVLRADNDEQGGVFALLALLTRYRYRSVIALSALLVFAAGMLLGDGVITPAISVLSAIEGLSVASDRFEHYTVPITLVVLSLLFALQRYGTKKVGTLFGPVMLIWFAYLALTGLHSITAAPRILEAFDPRHAVSFLSSLSLEQFTFAMGSVILVVTGGEALFADLGHIGKRPIRVSWFFVVYPALVLNYLGQGAHILSGAEVVNGNIFFSMVPEWALYPSIALATVATVIASQALISGAFSLVAQGIALKYLPTMRVIHTDDEREGQLYVPVVNGLLFVGAVFLVVTFHTSSDLAAAYGLAVAADMVVTTIAVAAVARLHWKWRIISVAVVFVPFLAVDGSLLAGNVWKIPSGGYVPIVIGTVMVTIMTTWRWGREQVRLAFLQHSSISLSEVVEIKRDRNKIAFTRPTVMLSASKASSLDDPAPPLLEMFYRRYEALPKQLILLRIDQTKTPHVSRHERYQISEFQNDPTDGSLFISVAASFGFRENPDVEDVIADILRRTPTSADEHATWLIYAAKERIVGAKDSGLFGRARLELFKSLRRQAEPAYNYFGLDDDARLTVEFVPVVI